MSAQRWTVAMKMLECTIPVDESLDRRFDNNDDSHGRICTIA